MLKFFQRIRRKLIDDGNLKRYLIYAIGEILLVVLGILIALQINNWNQEKKARKEEYSALSNLKGDFEFNLISIKKLISDTSGEIDSGVEILKHTGRKFKSSSNLELDSLLLPVTRAPRYFPQNGFLNDLINSGKIGIIENDSLRNELSSWIPLLEGLYRKEQSSLHHISLLMDYIKKNGSWLNIDNSFPAHGIIYPKSGFEVNNNKMLENLEFENLIDEVVNQKGGLRTRQRNVLEANKDVTRLINQELRKK